MSGACRVGDSLVLLLNFEQETDAKDYNLAVHLVKFPQPVPLNGKLRCLSHRLTLM